ncbi:hypothetical protein GALMADRAFT_1246114 [Galerina marginata CBS 339.88]|uniref:Uncharacterized protein n=1 Tax=Galerina marginata (strain CBS 339.88) TaxID=685588 RepID=A0A067TB93_GALM3|nr:hypothetical protein GALMADRAFT_1246114 [Galerina marginata CBS 339.88]
MSWTASLASESVERAQKAFQFNTANLGSSVIRRGLSVVAIFPTYLVHLSVLDRLSIRQLFIWTAPCRSHARCRSSYLDLHLHEASTCPVPRLATALSFHPLFLLSFLSSSLEERPTLTPPDLRHGHQRHVLMLL